MKASWISVRAVLEAAELAGVERERLRAAAGLDIADTQDAYGWIDGERYDALLQSAVALTQTPTFGLRWGASSPMMQFELLPLLIANAPTLRICLEVMRSIQAILSEAPQLDFHVEDKQVIVRVTPDARFSSVARRVMTDVSMAGLKRLLDYCTRGALRDLVRYEFAFSANEHEPEYRAAFGENLAFGCARSEARFAAALLETANPTHNIELFHALEKHFELLRARMATKLSYAEQVKSELRAALPRQLEMTEVAHALGMSERSLRRRLSDEGTSYSEVVESAQIELAQQLLSDPRASVKAVAFEVGFDTTSGFRRAFKRWTGENPAGYRARL